MRNRGSSLPGPVVGVRRLDDLMMYWPLCRSLARISGLELIRECLVSLASAWGQFAPTPGEAQQAHDFTKKLLVGAQYVSCPLARMHAVLRSRPVVQCQAANPPLAVSSSHTCRPFGRPNRKIKAYDGLLGWSARILRFEVRAIVGMDVAEKP